MSMSSQILCLCSPDKPGIVAAVATTLSNNQCNIEESAQFNDHLSGRFFMRVVFQPLGDGCLEGFKARFEEIAAEFTMEWSLHAVEAPVKTLLLVSKPDHCLNDLLYRWRTRHLPIEITAVVANHDDNRKLVEDHGLPFHHFPITKETKPQQEEQIRGVVDQTGAELIVMARYMQILSPEMCAAFPGRVINIHHSFLPGFKGAKPYHQAYERGVKVIGATAHFATADLDEGPIIEQETVHITHADTPDKLVRIGKDIESRVLARAIRAHAERRIFLQGHRTVIL